MQNFEELSALAIRQLFHGGAFLMTGKEEKSPMTIGWCQFGRVWNGPVITVFVRRSRHSWALLERDGVFTVCFPIDGDMKQELGFCGTKSGRDVDKRAALALAALEARAGGIGGLSRCRLHFECRVLHRLDMAGTLPGLEAGRRVQFYDTMGQAGDDGDPHVVYYAEVLDAYLIDRPVDR